MGVDGQAWIGQLRAFNRRDSGLLFYCSNEYDNRITIFATGKWAGAIAPRGVEIYEINGRHIEVLRQPHVQTIGQKLASRLQRIRDRQPKSNSVVTPIARHATQ
jgi:thioesterase domain-containing protein